MITENDSLYNFKVVLAPLIVVVFTGLLFLRDDLYKLLTLEGHTVESLTAILFFAGSVLFTIGAFRQKAKGNIFMILLAVISFVAGGEEISWGQHLFGFGTPDYLREINDQEEFNFHNINKKFFDRLLVWITILWVVYGIGIHLRNLKPIAFIRPPGIIVWTTGVFSLFYRQYNEGILNYQSVLLPLLLYAMIKCFVLKKRKSAMLYLFLLCYAIGISFLHIMLAQNFPTTNNAANEIREMLFSGMIFWYAVQLQDN